MRILIVHNKYQCQGGEDAVVEAEGALLTKYGHTVEYQLFDNAVIKTKADQFFTGIGMIYNYKSAGLLQQKICAFKPDLIHVHNIHLIVSPSVFYVANRAGIPVVLTLHNFRLICPSGSLFFDHRIYENSLNSLFALGAVVRGVYRKSRIQTAAIAVSNCLHNMAGTWERKVDRFIVMSEFAAKKFRNSALRVSGDKFFIKPHFVSDHGAGNQIRDRFFLFAGRLSEEKGIEMLLSAAALYSFQLVVIGDGPLKSRVLNFERNYPNIQFKGFQPKDQVIEHLKKCTALLFPSICYETFGLSVLEAFSTATPVIASRLGVLCDIIEDERNGLLFEPGNPHDLYSRISQLSADAALQKKLGANARISFERNYTEEINYRLLMQLYEELLRDSNHRNGSKRSDILPPESPKPERPQIANPG